jgi:hypothetical protein
VASSSPSFEGGIKANHFLASAIVDGPVPPCGPRSDSKAVEVAAKVLRWQPQTSALKRSSNAGEPFIIDGATVGHGTANLSKTEARHTAALEPKWQRST